MTDKLYCTLKKFSLRYAYFLFFDVEQYLADQLFIRHKVSVWFDQEYKREGSPYLGIVCHVKKKDVPRFLAALADLKNSMLLCGYTGYQEDIAKLLAGMERYRGGHYEQNTSGKAEQKEAAQVLRITARLLEWRVACNTHRKKQEGL